MGHQKEATAPPERFKDLENHSGTLLTQNLLIETPDSTKIDIRVSGACFACSK